MIESPFTKLFGSRLRTGTLFAIAAFHDTYASEIATVIGAHRPNVQRLLNDLEAEGIIVSRSGGARRVSLNPRYVAARELQELLERLIEANPAFIEALSRVRRRPRRPGKGGLLP